MFKVLSVVLAVLSVQSASSAQKCGENDTILTMKKPVYDFSMQFLHRISYGISKHFVYSPLSTWLQLVLLADGAEHKTLNEIWEVTGLRGYRKKTCYRRKFKEILNEMEGDSALFNRSTAVIIDKFFKIEKAFKYKAESLRSVKVAALDFDDPENAVIKANNLLKNSEENKESVTLVLPDDFYKRVLLIADLAYFKSAWQYPFNKAQTESAPFYSESDVQRGTVDMMKQMGYFKEAEIPLIDARVLELPFSDSRTSMFAYLPIKGSITNIYRSLQETTLTGIINVLKNAEPKPLNVYLPKFQIETEIVNIAELLYDMGVKRAFYPDTADLKRITKSGNINVSWMSQLSAINVTESHVEAEVLAESLLADSNAEDFNANRPFAFMLVDKKLEIILFAGIYSDPNAERTNSVFFEY